MWEMGTPRWLSQIPYTTKEVGDVWHSRKETVWSKALTVSQDQRYKNLHSPRSRGETEEQAPRHRSNCQGAPGPNIKKGIRRWQKKF